MVYNNFHSETACKLHFFIFFKIINKTNIICVFYKKILFPFSYFKTSRLIQYTLLKIKVLHDAIE